MAHLKTPKSSLKLAEIFHFSTLNFQISNFKFQIYNKWILVDWGLDDAVLFEEVHGVPALANAVFDFVVEIELTIYDFRGEVFVGNLVGVFFLHVADFEIVGGEDATG